MAHLTSKSAYQRLSDRLNRFPQGAPPTDLLFKILALLFSEREAALVSQLPVKPFNAKKAAAIWKIDEVEARNVLEGLASRAIRWICRRATATRSTSCRRPWRASLNSR